MAAGRPRKPTHLKIVTGTARADRLNAKEPKLAKGAPVPPDHLTPEGKAAWRYIVPKIERMGILTTQDAVALERLCELYGQIRAAYAALELPIMGMRKDKTTGELIPHEVAEAGSRFYVTYGQSGVMIRDRPEVEVIEKAEPKLLRYLTEFGLTPASRSKVSVLPEKTEDPADKYFA